MRDWSKAPATLRRLRNAKPNGASIWAGRTAISGYGWISLRSCRRSVGPPDIRRAAALAGGGWRSSKSGRLQEGTGENAANLRCRFRWRKPGTFSEAEFAKDFGEEYRATAMLQASCPRVYPAGLHEFLRSPADEDVGIVIASYGQGGIASHRPGPLARNGSLRRG